MYFKVKKNIKNFNPSSYVKESNQILNESFQNLKPIDCSLGVNPFGHSKNIESALKNFLENCSLSDYPSFPYDHLKHGITEYWKNCCHIENNNIRLGGGSIDILRSVNRAFIKKGTKVLGSAPTFTSYPSDVELCEGIFNYVPLSQNNNFKFDAEKFMSRITHEYALVYIDNPNNPTGQIIPLEHIRKIARKARENNVCVLIDEAYGDFMDENNSAINLVNEYENVMVTRTFSKGFGLAGLRVGYIIAGNYLSKIISKVDIPFTVNCLANYTAVAALKDNEFILKSRVDISNIKKNLMSSFKTIMVLETSPEVPIITLTVTDTNTNLHKLFFINGVLTESGEDFYGLGINYVRMRVPADYLELINRISRIEEHLKYNNA